MNTGNIAQWVDVGAAVFLLLGLMMGYFRGIIGEIIKIAALLAGGAGAFFFMNRIALYLMNDRHLPYILANVIGFFFLFGIAMILTPIIHFILNRIFLSGRKLSLLERASGLVFGGAKNTLIISIMTGILVLVPGMRKRLNSSITVRAYEAYFEPHLTKLLGKDSPLVTSRKLPGILENPALKEKLGKSKRIQEIVRDDKIQAVMNDPEIKLLIKNKDVEGLLRNEKINDLLKDPAMREKLRTFSQEVAKVTEDIE